MKTKGMDAARFLYLLNEALSDGSIDRNEGDAKPYPYSGRCMYGRECVGINITPNMDAKLGGAMVAAVYRDAADASVAEDEVDQLLDVLDDTHSDNMGYREIVVYWPNMDWPKDAPRPGDEDDDRLPCDCFTPMVSELRVTTRCTLCGFHEHEHKQGSEVS